MGPKYEFTDETMNYNGHILHRIRCISNDELGGWIESEENLSQEGDCWVYNNAKVYGDACVCDNAKVYGNAEVYDDACINGNAEIFGDAVVFNDVIVNDKNISTGNIS